jgi:hypothetical protein
MAAPSSSGGWRPDLGFLPPPRNYLGASLALATVSFVTGAALSLVTGIVAVVFGTRTQAAAARRDTAGAESRSRAARVWMIITLALLLAQVAAFAVAVVLTGWHRASVWLSFTMTVFGR